MRAGEGKRGFKLMRAIKGKKVLSAIDMKAGGDTYRGRGVMLGARAWSRYQSLRK